MTNLRAFLPDLAFRIETMTSPEAKEAWRFISDRSHESPERVAALRNDLLGKLVTHAYNNTVYYRRVMDERGLTPADFKTTDDIIKLPLLTKDIIRREGDALLASGIDQSRSIPTRSGGTTGEPITSVLDLKAYYIEYFAYWRGLRWMGWKPGMPIVKLFGGSMGTAPSSTLKSRLKNTLLNQHFFPAFQMGKDNVEAYVDSMKACRGGVIVGYASALYNLANMIAERGLKPPAFSAAFSTAEQMPDSWAAHIRTVLNCPVQSFYGCGEINSLGFQLVSGGAYRIPSDHVYIETLSGHPAGENVFGITALHNFAKPLIRYVNGDAGIVGKNEEGQDCITELTGRTADMFQRKDGTYISSILGTHSIFKSGTPVKRYQYIQKEYDLVEFRFEPDGKDVPEHYFATLRRIFEDQLGYPIRFEPRQTTDFIISANNKHRIMINMISKH